MIIEPFIPPVLQATQWDNHTRTPGGSSHGNTLQVRVSLPHSFFLLPSIDGASVLRGIATLGRVLWTVLAHGKEGYRCQAQAGFLHGVPFLLPGTLMPYREC